jgi:hypothetical protein
MKVIFKYDKKNMKPERLDILQNFVKFLNREYKLKNNVTIQFTNKSENGMTTGSNQEGIIKVLDDGRMFIDILRTLAHEWVHEHQHQFDRKKGNQDIGGPDEDEANAESGRLLKQYNKEFPKKENHLYE